MRFRDSVHGKCADVTFFGNNRVVQETDADPACNQCLDRNKAADGYFSVEVVEFLTGCDQPFFKNAACTGALFTDNNGLIQQVFNGYPLPAQGTVLGADPYKGFHPQ